MPMRHVKAIAAVLAALAVLAVAGPPASAHPHVWVAVEMTVVYDKGTVTALRQRWTFDELYTTMALEGLPAGKDGKYGREQLAELAKVNIEGLKEFDYFTVARLGDHPLEFAPPTDIYMEHGETNLAPGPAPDPANPDNATPPKSSGQSASVWSQVLGGQSGKAGQAPEKPKVLSLSFTLPLKQPVLAEARGLNFSTSDPTFFIWFDLAAESPVKLSDGAPAGCKATVSDSVPASDQAPSGSSPLDQTSGGALIGFGSAKVVAVGCSKP